MNLKNPSMPSAVALVGVGLVSLSGAIVFAASGRPALAVTDDDRRFGVRRTEIAAEPGQPFVVDGPPSMMSSGVVDECVGAGPLDWFGAIRWVPDCLRFPHDSHAPIGYADVNGSGGVEKFRYAEDQWSQPVLPPPPGDTCLLWLRTMTFDGAALEAEHACVLPASDVSEWLAENSDWTFAELEQMSFDSGWIDMDGDLDLDLFLEVRGGPTPPKEWGYRRLWLENTGFEATQPLTGDLDGDGAVGASDLTILLGGWTGG